MARRHYGTTRFPIPHPARKRKASSHAIVESVAQEFAAKLLAHAAGRRVTYTERALGAFRDFITRRIDNHAEHVGKVLTPSEIESREQFAAEVVAATMRQVRAVPFTQGGAS